MDLLPLDLDRHVFAQFSAVQRIKGQDHDLFRLCVCSDVSRRLQRRMDKADGRCVSQIDCNLDLRICNLPEAPHHDLGKRCCPVWYVSNMADTVELH